MKTLHLLRHAKSSWEEPHLGDRERVLNRRGKRDAPRMGAALGERLRPMVIHVSTAVRARLTLEGLCRGWAGLEEMAHVQDEALYTFGVDHLIEWLLQRPDGDHAAFLIGHNPALTDLVNWLVGHQCLDNLPTAGYTELSLPVERWQDLPRCTAVLEYRLFPKELPRS